ncbi:hypothetical protein [Paratractidigestivibacter sp.]|uniref:hypothetical protein n=1 Tax=Paratractidigestivibacter sp. TaxID=2847316 RepID=UPI003AB51712
MREPGDIPIVTGRGGKPAPDDAGLVWLVDGQDQPFRDASETARPWLEDSAEWVDGDSSPSDAPKPEDSGGLVWL